MEYTDASYSHRGCFLYYELYIDQFFAEHLLTGYLLLRLTALSLGKTPDRKKLVLAAAENAAVAALAVACSVLQSAKGEGWQYMILITGSLGSAAAAVRITFGKCRIRVFGKQMLHWVLNTIFFAGIQEVIVRAMAVSESTGTVFTAALMAGLLKFCEKRQICRAQTADVTVFWGENKLVLIGMIDTGNLLQEPLTGKPVSIVEKSAIFPLLGDNWQQRRGFYLIPYHSIGTEKGWLQAVSADRMEIRSTSGKVCVEQPILAIYEGRLSVQSEYQIILHPWHADEKGEEI